MITGVLPMAEGRYRQFSREADAPGRPVLNSDDQRSPNYNRMQYFGRIPAYPHLALAHLRRHL